MAVLNLQNKCNKQEMTPEEKAEAEKQKKDAYKSSWKKKNEDLPFNDIFTFFVVDLYFKNKENTTILVSWLQ